MFTQCPECGTVFRVSAAVLRAAHGQVRCGVCAATFDALAYLTDADGEPARPIPEPEPEPPAPDPEGLAELRARVASLQAEIPLEGEAADEEELEEFVEQDAADEEQPFDFEFDLGAAVPDPRPAADEARANADAAGTPARSSAPPVPPAPPRTPPRAPPVPPPPAPDLEAEVSESALEFNLPAEEWEQVFVTGEYPIAPENFAAPAPADEPHSVRARLGARVAEPPDDPLAQTDEYPALTEEEGSAGIEVIETTMYDPAADAVEPEAPIAEPPKKAVEPPARIAEPPRKTVEPSARIAEPPAKTVDRPRKTVEPVAPPKRTAGRRRRAEPEPVVDFDAVVAAAAARATGRAPEPPRAAPAREVVERRFTQQEPAEEPVERFELDAGRFRAAREPEEPQSPPLLRTARNAALVALLTLLLLVQVVHHSRERLAEQPRVGPSLMRLYRAFGASLEPRWNVAAYTVKQWGAAAEPVPGALRLRASIVNTANRAQPYPLLRVTLLDRFGGKVARREFTPGEYLPGRAPEAPLLAANGKVDADLMLSDPGSEATGFELDACLRRVGTLSCASDSGEVR